MILLSNIFILLTCRFFFLIGRIKWYVSQDPEYLRKQAWGTNLVVKKAKS